MIFCYTPARIEAGFRTHRQKDGITDRWTDRRRGYYDYLDVCIKPKLECTIFGQILKKWSQCLKSLLPRGQTQVRESIQFSWLQASDPSP